MEREKEKEKGEGKENEKEKEMGEETLSRRYDVNDML